MAKILIVDDEANIREVVREYCEINGFETEEAENGLEAIEKVKSTHFDCVILDVMMPVLDGFSTCKQIKSIDQVPVIMLSARQEEYDKLFGFELGVDDDVTKPFSPKELIARIKVVLERGKKTQTNSDVMIFKGLQIDVLGRVVTVDGEKAPLRKLIYFYILQHIQMLRYHVKLYS